MLFTPPLCVIARGLRRQIRRISAPGDHCLRGVEESLVGVTLGWVHPLSPTLPAEDCVSNFDEELQREIVACHEELQSLRDSPRPDASGDLDRAYVHSVRLGSLFNNFETGQLPSESCGTGLRAPHCVFSHMFHDLALG